MDDQKRFLLAMVLSSLIMAYFFFFANPVAKQGVQQAEIEQQKQEQLVIAPEPKSRTELLAVGTHIPINTPSLIGSFSTTGFRLDDIRLKKYKATHDEDSPLQTLLSPAGSEHAAEIFDNWTLVNGGSGRETPWGVVSGDTLGVGSPVVLQVEGNGFRVHRVVSIDENYLITLKDTVTNISDHEITLVRKGTSRQYGLPENLTNYPYILQEGPLSVVDGVQHDLNYKKLAKKTSATRQGVAGWAGLTDRYWLSAAIAPQGKQMTANYTYKILNGADIYEAGYVLAPETLSPNISIESTAFIYAGAKKREILNAYETNEATKISQLGRAIDYGRLRILSYPFSWGLTKLGQLTGNFGVGILLLTLIIKLVLFPLNNMAYSSMAKMRKLQPKIKKMQKRYGDDRVKLQQEMMALYRKEGANPVSGCLPMIPQMFIFFALYKSLFITLEMRQAPFVGWITDLSARDPLSILNGFGLFPWKSIPFEFMSFFALGPLALLYGITMALMQTLNTPPTDKTQARIMQFLPLFFMFILAPFAAGLLLYWVWNNILTIIQQYYITRKHKVHTPMDSFFDKIFGRAKDKAGDE